MAFPITRLRRLRQNETFRRMVRETTVTVDDLIMPLFVCPGTNVKEEISSMPGQYRFSVDKLADECKAIEQLGIPGVILFGIPEEKDPQGSGAYSETGIVQEARRAVRKEVGSLALITYVWMCGYTDHGHCVIIVDGDGDNDSTLELLGKTAMRHVQACAYMVSHSDSSDCRAC